MAQHPKVGFEEGLSKIIRNLHLELCNCNSEATLNTDVYLYMHTEGMILLFHFQVLPFFVDVSCH